MAGILNLPPGLRGWVAADQLNQQKSNNQLGQIQGILGIQGALQRQKMMEQELAQAPEMQRLKLELLKAQIAKAGQGSPSDQIKIMNVLQQQQGLQDFQNLVSKGGDWGPNTGTPSVVTPNQGGEEEALRRVMEAEAQGRPANVAAPTAGNLMAAAAKAGKPAMATPFMPKQGKVTSVAGGYLDEKGEFHRTQSDKDPNAGKVGRDPKDGKWKRINADGSFGVEAQAPTTSEEGQRNIVGGAYGKLNVKDLNELKGNAELASRGLVKINRLVDLLETADVKSGIGAGLFQDLNRLRAQFLKDKPATDEASVYQYLDALMGQQVFPAIKELGIGARGLDTPAEREFLRDVMMGTMKLEKGTLLRMAKDKQESAAQIIDAFNKKVDNKEYDPFYKEPEKLKIKYELSGGKKDATPQASDTMPKANMSNKGKFLRDTVTGKRYKSNGMQWVEVE